MRFPVFDLHCDTADYLAGLHGPDDTSLSENHAHIDLERAARLPGYAQCFACFTTPDLYSDPVTIFEKKLAAIHRELSKNVNRMVQVFSPDEIEKNNEQGKMSAI